MFVPCKVSHFARVFCFLPRLSHFRDPAGICIHARARGGGAYMRARISRARVGGNEQLRILSNKLNAANRNPQIFKISHIYVNDMLKSKNSLRMCIAS